MVIVNHRIDAALMLLLAIAVVGAAMWFLFPSKTLDRPDRALHYETRYGDHDGSVADGRN